MPGKRIGQVRKRVGALLVKAQHVISLNQVWLEREKFGLCMKPTNKQKVCFGCLVVKVNYVVQLSWEDPGESLETCTCVYMTSSSSPFSALSFGPFHLAHR